MTLRHPERHWNQFIRHKMSPESLSWVRVSTIPLVVIFCWVRMRPKVATLAVGLGLELLLLLVRTETKRTNS